MNIDYLKAQFPNYKITDASNRTNDEIIKISSICTLKKDILVIIERNAKNNDYFDLIEKLEGISHRTIKFIILNDDNYYHNSSLSNYFILHVKQKLDGEMNARFVLRNQMVNISFVVNVLVFVA